MEVPSQVWRPRARQYLKKQGKNLRLPGFRPGNIPESVLARYFGRSAVAGALRDIAQEILQQYLSEKKTALAGDPLVDFTEVPDYSHAQTVTITIRLGFKPTIPVRELLQKMGKTAVTRIEPAEEEVNNYIEYLRLLHGSLEEVGNPAVASHIRFSVMPDQEGVEAVQGTVPAWFFKQETLRKIQEGGVGAILVVNLDEELKVQAEEFWRFLPEGTEEKWGSPQRVRLITRAFLMLKPAELNQDFFVRVLGRGARNLSEEQFRQTVTERLKEYYQRTASRKFLITLLDELARNASFSLPENYLRRLYEVQTQRANQQPTEEDYRRWLHRTRIQLILGELLRAFNAQPTSEEIRQNLMEEIDRWAQEENLTFDEKQKEYLASVLMRRDTDYTDQKALDIAIQKLLNALKEEGLVMERESSIQEFVESSRG